VHRSTIDAMQESARVRCPWCGERFETLVDPEQADALYVEDCPVCCRPIEMQAMFDGAVTRLNVDRE